MNRTHCFVLSAALLGLAACAGDPRIPPAPTPGQPVSALPAQMPAADVAPGTTTATTTVPPPIDDAAADSLTRADCIRIALEANRGYLQKGGARERARLQANIAHAELYRPTLKADYTKTADNPDDSSGLVEATLPVMGVEVRPFTSFAWDQATGDYDSAFGIAFSRRVFALAEHVRLRLPLSQAEVDYLASAYDMISSAKTLERDVTSAFFAVLNARAKVRLRESRVVDAAETLRIAQENVKHGFKPKSDLLFAEISLNQAESDLLRDAGAERDAVERLLDQLARPLDTRLQLMAEDLERLPDPPADFASDVNNLLEAHEELLVQDARIRLLMERARVVRDEVAPELTATLSAERRMTGTDLYGNEIEDEDVLALRFDLSLPLDGQRVERAKLLQIRRQIDDQRLARADAASRLERSLRASWRGWLRARSEAELSITRVETERQRLIATQARYEAGEVDNLEVVRAKQAVDDAEIRLLDARIALANAVAEYRSLLPAVKRTEQVTP